MKFGDLGHYKQNTTQSCVSERGLGLGRVALPVSPAAQTHAGDLIKRQLHSGVLKLPGS